jgi:hypothetical protein
MNHKNMSLAIVGIVAALALTGVAFAMPQQVLAYKHHHSHNSIKVDQQINQTNFCDNGAQCLNNAENNFGPSQVVTVWK